MPGVRSVRPMITPGPKSEGRCSSDCQLRSPLRGCAFRWACDRDRFEHLRQESSRAAQVGLSTLPTVELAWQKLDQVVSVTGYQVMCDIELH